MRSDRSLTSRLPWLRLPRSAVAIGTVFLIAVVIATALLALKPQLSTLFRSGDTITAEFSRDYRLYAHETKVKMAGLEVGVVSDVERTDRDTVLVSMKVDESAIDKLGPEPSATVAAKTVLGGQYSIELSAGGGSGHFDREFIPLSRTSTPVELDRVLEALPQPTRKSLQDVVDKLDETLANGGKAQLRRLVQDAPAVLKPANGVLKAVRGTRPGIDLRALVTNLNSTAETLTRRDGQLSDIVTSLRRTTDVLAEQSAPLAAGINTLPGTMRETQAGLVDARGTLGRLTQTANSLRPAARELDPLLRRLDPVLSEARPLLHDLRSVLADAQPVVRELVPVAEQVRRTLAPLPGPVLERINGPIATRVMHTWRGKGPYKNSGRGMQADHKFYEELGYLVANMDRASMVQDVQGSMLNFQVGANTRTLAGQPLTLSSLLEQLSNATGGR